MLIEVETSSCVGDWGQNKNKSGYIFDWYLEIHTKWATTASQSFLGDEIPKSKDVCVQCCCKSLGLNIHLKWNEFSIHPPKTWNISVKKCKRLDHALYFKIILSLRIFEMSRSEQDREKPPRPGEVEWALRNDIWFYKLRISKLAWSLIKLLFNWEDQFTRVSQWDSKATWTA